MTIRISVTDRSGDERAVEARPDSSLMEAIRAVGLDEMLATCGGCCSCATCHVYVDGPDGTAVLPRVSEDEDDLLDMSEHRTSRSRLSCQVLLHDGMVGLRATIAPED